MFILCTLFIIINWFFLGLLDNVILSSYYIRLKINNGKNIFIYFYSYVYELFLVSFMLGAIGFKEESKKLMIFSAFMFFGLLFFLETIGLWIKIKQKENFYIPHLQKFCK